MPAQQRLSLEEATRENGSPYGYLVSVNAEDLEHGGLGLAADIAFFATPEEAKAAGVSALGRQICDLEGEHGGKGFDRAMAKPGPIAEYLVVRYTADEGTDEEWRYEPGGYGKA